jgi:hypothetical protein
MYPTLMTERSEELDDMKKVKAEMVKSARK